MNIKRSALVTLALASLLGLTMAGVATATHTRELSTGPTKIALVPAYKQFLSSPTGTCPGGKTQYTHAGPLTAAACGPVEPSGVALTTGTKSPRDDGISSTFPPQQTGFVRLEFCSAMSGAGTPCSIPGSFPDIAVTSTITDVRCRITGSGTSGGCSSVMGDYTGALIISATIRITDHRNVLDPNPGTGCSSTESCTATVADLPFTVPVVSSLGAGNGCATTDGGATTIGSTCGVKTSVNTFKPGVVVAGKKGNTEINNVNVIDPGTDFGLGGVFGGDPTDNGRYMTLGIYTP